MAKTNKISKIDAEIALTLRGLGTREQALAKRLDLDVAKWGEGERRGEPPSARPTVSRALGQFDRRCGRQPDRR